MIPIANGLYLVDIRGEDGLLSTFLLYIIVRHFEEFAGTFQVSRDANILCLIG